MRVILPTLLALSQAAVCFASAAAARGELLYDRESQHHEPLRLDLAKRAFPNASAVIQSFEVVPPVLGPGGLVIGGGRPDPYADVDVALGNAGDASCTVRLVDRVFANSFNVPALFDYVPPACVAQADAAMTNLTVQTMGRQFDRLSFV